MLKPENAKEQLADLVADSKADDVNKLGFDSLKLSQDQCRFVNRIVERHGGGILFRSKKRAIELKVADPILLEQDGDKELTSRHLYINVDKAVNENHMKAARCVKDGRIYDIRVLLQMLPIEDRALNIPKSKVNRRVSVIDRLKHMERDAMGNLIPPGPGECTPVNELEEGHPALVYIRERGFDPDQLVKQFGASYCTAENPKMFYKKLPGGFRATPQCRIVFFINQLGVNRGWQARRLERRIGDELQLLHPYKGTWETVANYTKSGIDIVPRFKGCTIGAAPSIILKNKYIIGIGVEKSRALMGFDAALEWSKVTGNKTIGIVEGVFDAARLGPPFCSIMGLDFSSSQAALVANHFDRVVYTPDNDLEIKPNQDKNNATIFCEGVEDALNEKNIKLIKAPPPSDVGDAGDMSPDQVAEFKNKYLL